MDFTVSGSDLYYNTGTRGLFKELRFFEDGSGIVELHHITPHTMLMYGIGQSAGSCWGEFLDAEALVIDFNPFLFGPVWGTERY